MWYVYIIRNINFPDQEYTGASADLKQRIPAEHLQKRGYVKMQINKNKKIGITISIIAIIAFSESAFACISTPEEIKNAYESADLNHDGTLDINEYFKSMSPTSANCEMARNILYIG